MGNSIIDGLKSRLMQYLKHVVEDNVLFTKVISKFKPVTFRCTIDPLHCTTLHQKRYPTFKNGIFTLGVAVFFAALSSQSLLHCFEQLIFHPLAISNEFSRRKQRGCSLQKRIFLTPALIDVNISQINPIHFYSKRVFTLSASRALFLRTGR